VPPRFRARFVINRYRREQHDRVLSVSMTAAGYPWARRRAVIQVLDSKKQQLVSVGARQCCERAKVVQSERAQLSALSCARAGARRETGGRPARR